MTSMRSITRLSLGAVFTACLLGCQKNYTDVSFAGIRKHPAPEMSQLAFTKADGRRALATMKNQNLRMFWDDFNRVWYLDHPSRLSGWPVVYTSGEPR